MSLQSIKEIISGEQPSPAATEGRTDRMRSDLRAMIAELEREYGISATFPITAHLTQAHDQMRGLMGEKGARV